MVLVGAAKADISPQQPVYLGGYGFGPVRLSTGVLQPLYARALAIRAPDNRPEHTLIFAALDSQGYFAAYQSGPYGIADMRATISQRLQIPVANIVIASTHSHAAPDTVGFWGGVPAEYLRRVYNQTIAAITHAVTHLAPARLRSGTASIDGYVRSFGSDQPGQQPWLTDTQIRALQALSVQDGHSLATLLNVSVHPTALGASNTKAAPDWPGATATQLEQRFGGTAIIMIGALGHAWPGAPASLPQPNNRLEGMQRYGTYIAQQAISALQQARPIASPTLCAANRTFREVVTSAPLLTGLQFLGRSGHERILRSLTAPYFVPPDVLGIEVSAFRIGDEVFFAAPVEAYPSLFQKLRTQIPAFAAYFFGLANDQLGYATSLGEYAGALSNSPTDEALFIVAPTFGEDLVQQLSDAAHQIGF